jgi:endonuclease/exonuclease/phosphatase (EEP) superfamily protein YafD
LGSRWPWCWVAGFLLIPWPWRLDPRFVALVPAAPQFAVAAVILAVGFLLLRSRKAVAVAFGVAVWNIVQFRPALSDPEAGAQAQAGITPPSKVTSFNLWYANTDPGAILAYLAHSDADVIGLVEATPILKDALSPFKGLSLRRRLRPHGPIL